VIIIKTTYDGSSTLYVPDLDEHYHSMNGAVQESQHVYIEAGLSYYINHRFHCKKLNQNEIQILEFGFGTGLNALLTADLAERQKIKIHYTALEKFPLSEEITNQLNYSDINKYLFQKIHQSDWEKTVSINSYFDLKKINLDFVDFDFSQKFDIIYYDAFAPDKQPEVWTQELFDNLFSSMNQGGILTTYCAKGNIRRMLQKSGFTVERIPGASGKREMLRANVLCKTNSDKENNEKEK